MALRNVLLDGEELLRKKSKDVKEITPRIKTLIEDMKETMIYACGVGLAAPQVGILKKVIVIDIGEGWNVFINPEIISQEGMQYVTEACLSVPNREGKVERPQKVTVKALNEDGEEFTLEAEGFLAQAICHEVDHLYGILFTDIMKEEVFEEEETFED